MRTRMSSPVTGVLLAALGAVGLVTLPGSAAPTDRWYLHSKAGGYVADAQADPVSVASGYAPAGSTMDNTPPAKTSVAEGPAVDAADFHPGLGASFRVPKGLTVSTLCLDVWVSAEAAGDYVLSVYLQTGPTFGPGSTNDYVTFSGLPVKVGSGLARVTGLVKITVADSADSKIVTKDNTALVFSTHHGRVPYYVNYDAVTAPSSVIFNPASCTPGPVTGPPPSASAAPSEEPGEEPSEQPSEEPGEEPSVEPSASVSVDPSAAPCPSVEPSEEPGEEPSESAPAMPRAARAAAVEECPSPSSSPVPLRDTVVRNTGAKSGRYADTVVLVAKVTDETGVPANGGTVTFLVGPTAYRGAVNPQGVASVRARLVGEPGVHVLETRYSGATGFAPSAVQDGFRLSKGVAVCAIQRGVTATGSALTGVLSHQDGTRIASAPVTFLYNGRGVLATRTDARGIARATAPKGRAGDTFSVVFGGDSRHTGCRADRRA